MTARVSGLELLRAKKRPARPLEIAPRCATKRPLSRRTPGRGIAPAALVLRFSRAGCRRAASASSSANRAAPGYGRRVSPRDEHAGFGCGSRVSARRCRLGIDVLRRRCDGLAGAAVAPRTAWCPVSAARDTASPMCIASSTRTDRPAQRGLLPARECLPRPATSRGCCRKTACASPLDERARPSSALP